MALEAIFRQLVKQIHQLHDALHALSVTVGDRPEDHGAALADDLDNTVLDLVGVLHQARKAALNARQAVMHPVDLDRSRRALTVCQSCFHSIEQQFAAKLVSYEKLKELARLGGVRGGEWLPWATSTMQAIEECRLPVEAVSLALVHCWQEIAERLGTTSISVQNSNIGQTFKADHIERVDVEEAVHEGT